MTTRRFIQRHSLLTRVTHGVAAISCILLAVTGLFVFWPELGGSIMGGDFTQTMRSLHRWLAVPFILVPLFAVLKSPKGFAHLIKEDIFGKWDKDDFTWAAKFPFYLFAPGTLLFWHLVHDIFFFLTVFVGIAHIYLGAGIFQPYRGTIRIMFGDGKVSESDAAYHWGYWANEEIALGRNVTVEEVKKK